MPFNVTQLVSSRLAMEITVEKMDANVPLDAAVFKMPENGFDDGACGNMRVEPCQALVTQRPYRPVQADPPRKRWTRAECASLESSSGLWDQQRGIGARRVDQQDGQEASPRECPCPRTRLVGANIRTTVCELRSANRRRS